MLDLLSEIELITKEARKNKNSTKIYFQLNKKSLDLNVINKGIFIENKEVSLFKYYVDIKFLEKLCSRGIITGNKLNLLKKLHSSVMNIRKDIVFKINKKTNDIKISRCEKTLHNNYYYLNVEDLSKIIDLEVDENKLLIKAQLEKMLLKKEVDLEIIGKMPYMAINSNIFDFFKTKYKCLNNCTIDFKEKKYKNKIFNIVYNFISDLYYTNLIAQHKKENLLELEIKNDFFYISIFSLFYNEYKTRKNLNIKNSIMKKIIFIIIKLFIEDKKIIKKIKNEDLKVQAKNRSFLSNMNYEIKLLSGMAVDDYFWNTIEINDLSQGVIEEILNQKDKNRKKQAVESIMNDCSKYWEFKSYAKRKIVDKINRSEKKKTALKKLLIFTENESKLLKINSVDSYYSLLNFKEDIESNKVIPFFDIEHLFNDIKLITSLSKNSFEDEYRLKLTILFIIYNIDED